MDWLELSFRGELPDFIENPETFYINNNCFLEFTNNRNQYFQTIVNLWINNRKIGELKYNPSTAFIDENTVHFKIENHLLYSKDYPLYIDYLQTILGLKFQHIVRIDIATDTINHNLLNFIRKYHNSTNIRIKGKQKKITINSKGKIYKTVYFGSMSSEKFIKIYNKTQELKAKDKAYIKGFWKLNNLNYQNNEVERIELTLKTKQAKYIDLNKLPDPNYLASICRTHFKNYFEFIGTYRQNNKTVKKDVTPLQFNEFQTQLLEKYKHIQKFTTKAQKMELKRLFFNIQITKELIEIEHGKQNTVTELYIAINNFSGAIRTINKLYNLEQYYDQNNGFWKKEFDKNKTIYLNNITLPQTA